MGWSSPVLQPRREAIIFITLDSPLSCSYLPSLLQGVPILRQVFGAYYEGGTVAVFENF